MSKHSTNFNKAGIYDIIIYFSYHIPGQFVCRREATECVLNPHYTPLNRRASNNRSLRTISWSTVLSALRLKQLHCAQLVTKHVMHKFLNLPERLGASSHAISDTKGAYPSKVIILKGRITQSLPPAGRETVQM